MGPNISSFWTFFEYCTCNYGRAFPVSHKLIHPVGRSIRRQCQFYNIRVWDEAIKVCIQLYESHIHITGIILKRLIYFLHILFNYICQNRILSSHWLICPSSHCSEQCIDHCVIFGEFIIMKCRSTIKVPIKWYSCSVLLYLIDENIAVLIRSHVIQFGRYICSVVSIKCWSWIAKDLHLGLIGCYSMTIFNVIQNIQRSNKLYITLIFEYWQVKSMQ